jgi:hypothetical protein
MNYVATATCSSSAVYVDPRLGFLNLVAGLNWQVENGEIDIVAAFDLVVDEVNSTDLFRIVVPEREPRCDVCLREPCITPKMCAASRQWIGRGRRL